MPEPKEGIGRTNLLQTEKDAFLSKDLHLSERKLRTEIMAGRLETSQKTDWQRTAPHDALLLGNLSQLRGKACSNTGASIPFL